MFKLNFKLLRTTLTAASIAVSGMSFAAAKTLITYEGGKPGPGVAKSWKKGKGNYTFTLDPAADVGQGGKTAGAIVKSSLESKLGASNGVKVTEKGKDVVVSYTGDEKAFLEALSKTRIRSGDSVEIAAADSTVSQGGIRAKTTERDPIEGEVKGTIVNTKADAVTIRVVTASAKAKELGIKDGDKVEVKTAGYKGKKGEAVFFTPTAKEGTIWGASEVKAN